MVDVSRHKPSREGDVFASFGPTASNSGYRVSGKAWRLKPAAAPRQPTRNARRRTTPSATRVSGGADIQIAVVKRLDHSEIVVRVEVATSPAARRKRGSKRKEPSSERLRTQGAAKTKTVPASAYLREAQRIQADLHDMVTRWMKYP